MSIKKFIIGVILILSLTIFIDQLTKYIAFIVLFKDQQVLVINHYLNFRPVWNDGISFGMLQGYGDFSRVAFIIIALIILIDQLTKYVAFIVLFKEQQVLIINPI